MLLNTVLKSATARQFQDTIFKILRVLQYCISSILSQSVQNIRLIGCYLLPDHQDVDKYLYSLTFIMQSSTTARQTSNCMQIITYHVVSFRTNFFFKYSMSDSLALPWFRVNTDLKNWIILCCIPDNCAIALFCFGSTRNDHFSPFENSTKFKMKMS